MRYPTNEILSFLLIAVELSDMGRGGWRLFWGWSVLRWALWVLSSPCFPQDSRSGGAWGSKLFGSLPQGLLLGVGFHV